MCIFEKTIKMAITREFEKTVEHSVNIPAGGGKNMTVPAELTYHIQYTSSPSGYSVDMVQIGEAPVEMPEIDLWDLFGDWIMANEKVIDREFYRNYNTLAA